MKTVKRTSRESNRMIKVIVTQMLCMLMVTGAFAFEEEPPYFVAEWGGYGSGDGQFDRPIDVVIDSSGDVFVLDRYNHRIQKFDSDGNFLTKWGSYGWGDGQFDRPRSMALAPNGDIYVAGHISNRIQKFDSNGNFLLKWGSTGSGDGEFKDASGVAVDSYGNVYTAERDNHRIQKFDSDGNFLLKWGSYGEGIGQFDHCNYVAIDSDDCVYVSDDGNNRVQVFDSDGVFMRQWWGENHEVRGPHAIAWDSNGNVYLACPSKNYVLKLTPYGEVWTLWGKYGSGPGEFSGSTGVAVDSDDTIYVADYGNHRIQKFSFSYPPTETPSGSMVDATLQDSSNPCSFPAALTFEQVTGTGETSLATSESGSPPPSGFQLGDPPTYYDITTTATYSGSITICIDYSKISYSDPSLLRLHHYEDGEWEDCTISNDIPNKIICGRITSLSPFAVFMGDPKQLVQLLVQQVLDLNLQSGIENSLDAKLDAALKAIDDLNANNDVAAINSLRAFISAVEAQRGKNIPVADADALIATAQQIIDLLI